MYIFSSLALMLGASAGCEGRRQGSSNSESGGMSALDAGVFVMPASCSLSCSCAGNGPLHPYIII